MRDGFCFDMVLSQPRTRGITRTDRMIPPAEGNMSEHTERARTPARHFACGHVVPDCEFTASAPTEEELLKKVAGHAAQAHGITEITPELASQVMAAIETR